MDAAHRWTDEQLASLERRMHSAYSQAASEMRAKQARLMAEYGKEREMRERAMDDTAEARAEHASWLREQSVKQAYVNDMVNQLSEDAHRANEKALEALEGHIPNVYMENANRASYGLEMATGGIRPFALVDEDTVRRLIKDEPNLLPKVDAKRDVRWNRRKFGSAITQGILQGESVDDIGKRLMSVMKMNESAAIRAARTATTGAENAGRTSSYERAKEMGIDLKQEWLATLDGRTRHSHRQLDGQRVDVGKKFENGCRYPGDPEGPAEEVYNCRCTLVAYIPGIEYEDWRKDERIDGMSYEEWKAEKSREDVGGLDRQPLSATAGYTGTTSASILNDALRRGDDTSSYSDVIARLDGNMQAMTRECVLYRDMNMLDLYKELTGEFPPSGGTLEDLKAAVVGKSFTDKAYMSCSTDYFGTYGSGHMTIRCKKGTKAIYTSNMAEKEVILGRDTTLKCVDVVRNEKGFEFVMETVPKPDSAIVSKHVVAEGTDILGTWKRRPDEFDFEIEDVMAAQGFDGKPRIVDADEFDRAVREANGGDGLVMQRSYSAPDQATLDAYRDMLYDGKWYVDCSTGGSQYGQGMYAAADYTGKVTADMQKEMRHYTTLNQGRLGAQPLSDEGKEAFLRKWVGENVAEADRDAAFTYLKFESHTGKVEWADVGKAVEHLGEEKRLSLLESGVHEDVHQMLDGHSYVETMTLDPSAKIVTHADLRRMKDEYGREAYDWLDEQKALHQQMYRDGKITPDEGRALDQKSTEEFFEKIGKAQDVRNMDDGSFAAGLGYDAINAVGHGASGSYTVVLNRTKLVIRRPE